jgi:hypothetical protein
LFLNILYFNIIPPCTYTFFISSVSSIFVRLSTTKILCHFLMVQCGTFLLVFFSSRLVSEVPYFPVGGVNFFLASRVSRSRATFMESFFAALKLSWNLPEF